MLEICCHVGRLDPIRYLAKYLAGVITLPCMTDTYIYICIPVDYRNSSLSGFGGCIPQHNEQGFHQHRTHDTCEFIKPIPVNPGAPKGPLNLSGSAEQNAPACAGLVLLLTAAAAVSTAMFC